MLPAKYRIYTCYACTSTFTAKFASIYLLTTAIDRGEHSDAVNVLTI